jgi:hypothetical protein
MNRTAAHTLASGLDDGQKDGLCEAQGDGQEDGETAHTFASGRDDGQGAPKSNAG